MATGQSKTEDSGGLEREILGLARRAFRPLKHIQQIDSLDDICPAHFFQLFEIVLGETVPGWRETRNQRQEANVCQFLINTLEDDVFGVPLDHITGEAIARGDPRSVKDLLEIFCELTDEFCGRSPLAEISDIKSPEDRNRNVTNAKDITADPGFIPPEIRKLLARINTDAETIAHYSQSSGLLDALKSSHSIKEIFTQTTPVPMTSAVTSPITWDFILKKRELQNAEKGRTKPASHPQPVTRKTIPRARTTVPGTRARSMQKSLGPKKSLKPRPVLGSKLRRSSSSSCTLTKPGQSPISKKSSLAKKEGDAATLLQLVEHTEKVITRRREIAREIKRLQNEESILKTTEAILKKELQYLQSKPPNRPCGAVDALRGRTRAF
ncbi:uncharacterized protein LOC111128661 isoform X1 [Crassostrea virginica]